MKMLMAVTVAFMLAMPALGFGEDLDRALHEAAENGNVEAIKVLLEAGADVNARNEDGGTPLHSAAARAHAKAVKRLLKEGADVNAKNKSGVTPLHVGARKYPYLAMVLLEAGADVHAKDEAGRTALHWAALGGHADVAGALLKAGADPNAKDGKNRRPCDINSEFLVCSETPYRDAKMEQRWQADRKLVHEPSPGKERAAMARARAAVRDRDRVGLEAAARGLVVHAPDGVAAGWNNAAAVWADFSRSSRAYGNDGNDGDDYYEDDRAEARRMAGHALGEAAYGLYAAYRSSADPGSARETLGALSMIQEVRGEYIGAELALLGSLTEEKDPGAEDRLNRIRNEHGFRLLDVRTDHDRDDPRACLALSAAVARERHGTIADYVAVTPGRGDHPVVLRERVVCIGNLDHGAEYLVRVRDGLVDVHGRTVVPGESRVLVADRPARASFPGGRYVLPKVGSIGVPLTTVNMEEVPLTLLRITEGNLVDAVMGRSFAFGRDLDGFDTDRIVDSLGELEWQGSIAVKGVRNRKTVTAVPVDTLMPERKPGVYLLVAARDLENEERDRWSDHATQWLVVSDIGLTTVRGADGLSVFARSLATAEPMAGVTLALQARNEDTLAETATDTDGRAAFAPGLLRGSGGRRAVLLRARTATIRSSPWPAPVSTWLTAAPTAARRPVRWMPTFTRTAGSTAPARWST